MFPLKDTYSFKTANASHASQTAPHPAGALVTEVMVTKHETSSGNGKQIKKCLKKTYMIKAFFKTVTTAFDKMNTWYYSKTLTSNKKKHNYKWQDN